MILLRLKQASVFFMLEQQNTKRTKKTENFFFLEQFYFPQKMISTQKENPEAQAVKGLYKLGDYPRYVGQTPPLPTPAHSPLHRTPLHNPIHEQLFQSVSFLNIESRIWEFTKCKDDII